MKMPQFVVFVPPLYTYMRGHSLLSWSSYHPVSPLPHFVRLRTVLVSASGLKNWQFNASIAPLEHTPLLRLRNYRTFCANRFDFSIIITNDGGWKSSECTHFWWAEHTHTHGYTTHGPWTWWMEMKIEILPSKNLANL